MTLIRSFLLLALFAGTAPVAEGRSLSEACGSLYRSLFGGGEPTPLALLERTIAGAKEKYLASLADSSCDPDCLEAQRAGLAALWNDRVRMGKGYAVRPMGRGYKQEHTAGYVAVNHKVHVTKYLREDELREYEVLVDANGDLRDAAGGLVNHCHDHRGKMNCHPVLFVMDADGRIFLQKSTYYHKEGEAHFHHSSFVSGLPVAAAGEIEVKDGKILKLSNNSGHYQPPRIYLEQVVQELRKRGAPSPAFGLSVLPPLAP